MLQEYLLAICAVGALGLFTLVISLVAAIRLLGAAARRKYPRPPAGPRRPVRALGSRGGSARTPSRISAVRTPRGGWGAPTAEES